MSKAADMAKTSVKGGFHVMWGLFASTIISAVGAIILALALGENNYGLYAIVLTAPNLIGLFQDLGVGMAVTRYAAQFNVENRAAQIRGVFLSALIFKTVLGITLSLLCLVLSPYLAVTLFHRPLLTPLIQVVSFIILAQALVSTATSAFTGVEKMHLNSVMVVCQSILKTVLAPALVLLGLSLYGAVIGTTVAYLVTVLIGVFLVWTIYKNLPSSALNKQEMITTLKSLLKFGLPLSFSNIIGGFLVQFYAFILAIYVANNALIGNYNVATNFLVIITFVVTPINTMLYPAFSKIDPDQEHDTFKHVFRSSVKYSTLLVIPVVAMVIALAVPAVSTIFAANYAKAPLYLALLAINYLVIAFGEYSTSNIINSQEQASIKLVLILVTVGVGVPLGIFAVSRFGVVGLLVTLIFDGVPSTIIGLAFVQRRYCVTIDWASSGKILLSSAVAGALAYFIVAEFRLPSVIQLLLGVASFLFCYIGMIVLTRGINRADMVNLREMTRGQGQ